MSKASSSNNDPRGSLFRYKDDEGNTSYAILPIAGVKRRLDSLSTTIFTNSFHLKRPSVKISKGTPIMILDVTEHAVYALQKKVSIQYRFECVESFDEGVQKAADWLKVDAESFVETLSSFGIEQKKFKPVTQQELDEIVKNQTNKAKFKSNLENQAASSHDVTASAAPASSSSSGDSKLQFNLEDALLVGILSSISYKETEREKRARSEEEESEYKEEPERKRQKEDPDSQSASTFAEKYLAKKAAGQRRG
ncbi:hypothetical protein N9W34_02745 [Rickettsiales bacterium]|nr:hypothetical protein [Rickettsiales bacterium]